MNYKSEIITITYTVKLIDHIITKITRRATIVSGFRRERVEGESEAQLTSLTLDGEKERQTEGDVEIWERRCVCNV